MASAPPTQAPTPTAPPTPVIDIGRVVSRGVGAIRANFLPFFVVAVLCSGLPSFLQQYALYSGLDFNDTGAFFIFNPLFWGGMVFGVLGYFLLQGFVTRSSILTMMGRDPDHAQSFLAALRMILPLFGLAIVSGLATVLGFLLLFFPGIMVIVAFIVSVPALVEERKGVFESIQRSRDLTRGSRWLIFLLLILYWVVSVIVSTLLNTVAGVSMLGPELAAGASTGNLPNALLAGAAAGLASALTGLFTTVLTASLYVELRTVKEGASTEVLAGIFE
ncbi:MAG TPA: hypothetical protein VIT38_14005 [Allosphingosinicella sp.]